MFLASDTPIEIAPVAITVTAVVTVVFSHVNYADHRSTPTRKIQWPSNFKGRTHRQKGTDRDGYPRAASTVDVALKVAPMAASNGAMV